MTLLPLRAAAAGAVLCGAFGAPAFADVVLTADGQWHGLPRDLRLGADEKPSEEHLRKSADFRVDATYDTVKARGWSTSAGLVREIWASDQEVVLTFKEGMQSYVGGIYGEATEAFRLAAEEATTPFGKQQALFLRAAAFADAGDARATTAAIDDLLAQFPNTYYFADAHIMKARAAAGDPAAVAKALDAVKSAKNMNPRDLYRAELTRIFLLLEVGRKWAEAKQAYEALLQQIDKGDAAQGQTLRHRAQVGIGNSLLRLAPPQPDAARAAFTKAITESKDPDVLANAYAGLGDVAFATAKRLQDDKKTAEANDALVTATTHYLRVTIFYRERVTDETPVIGALENQAKAFVALFDQSDGKDCKAAERAYAAYFDLHAMLPSGPHKRRIVAEATEFNQRRKERGCK